MYRVGFREYHLSTIYDPRPFHSPPQRSSAEVKSSTLTYSCLNGSSKSKSANSGGNDRVGSFGAGSSSEPERMMLRTEDPLGHGGLSRKCPYSRDDRGTDMGDAGSPSGGLADLPPPEYLSGTHTGARWLPELDGRRSGT